jgi:hypothetical protein
VLGVKEDG